MQSSTALSPLRGAPPLRFEDQLDGGRGSYAQEFPRYNTASNPNLHQQPALRASDLVIGGDFDSAGKNSIMVRGPSMNNYPPQ